MKKLLSLAVAVLLMICLLPSTVKADEVTEYPLWVAGVQFTSANLTIDAGDSTGIASGKATYDPTSNTLTLDGLTYTGAGYQYIITWPGTTNEASNAAGIWYESEDALTVALANKNTVTVTGYADYSYGFTARTDNGVTITGTGSLTAKGADDCRLSYGMQCWGPITVEKQAELVGTAGDNSATQATASQTLI